jgi:NADPH-dependent curcumin reductase CurA
MNRRFVLIHRPVGPPTPADFELTTVAVPQPGDGEVVRRTIYLSLDPYMRGRMSDAPSYAKAAEIGQVMVGATVSAVVASRHPGFRDGDVVLTQDGWQEYGVSDGRDLRKLDPAAAPISTALGVLGMPGLTAWYGLVEIGHPKEGETVVVSAASGAVGSVVGQLAKRRGCRAVGIAGAPEKCAYVTEVLGFDACVSHRSHDLAGDLKRACPNGIDVYFENVGGMVFEVVLRQLNAFARVPVCGLIAQYNDTENRPGPNLRPVLTKRLLLQGFIVSDHFDRLPDFMQECAPLVRQGELRYREDIVDGLDVAPAAFIGLLEGKNFGKQLVRVSEDPTLRRT